MVKQSTHKFIVNLLYAALGNMQINYAACLHNIKLDLIYTVKALMCEYHSLALALSADSLSGFTGTKNKIQ